MNLNELVAVVANVEERGELEKLDEIGLPPGNVVQWLFGLTSGFYFADGETRRTRQAMLDLGLRYYDLAEGNANVLSFNERVRRISSRDDVANYLSQDEYFDEAETASFYIRHMPKQALRSTDPVHDYFTVLLPSVGYRGGNGRLMYQTRLSELSRNPTGVVRLFVDACRDLRVFMQCPACRFSSIPMRQVRLRRHISCFVGFQAFFTKMAAISRWKYCVAPM